MSHKTSKHHRHRVWQNTGLDHLPWDTIHSIPQLQSQGSQPQESHGEK